MPERMRKSASSAGIYGEAESQFVVLRRPPQRRQLSEQEKSLLAHEKETLEYKRQLAELVDKIEHQKRLNELAQQAARFAQQQRAKTGRN